MSAFTPYVQSALRIAAAFSFTLHGTQKLFAWPVTQPRDAVDVFTQIGLAGILEAFGGLLMLVGLFTRPVAFILSGEMAVAYFQAHFPQSFWPILNGGEPALLFCFIWLFFSAAGPGPISLDVLLKKSRRAAK